jgi:hypothetical protein
MILLKEISQISFINLYHYTTPHETVNCDRQLRVALTGTRQIFNTLLAVF